jgi:hypothetical protein
MNVFVGYQAGMENLYGHHNTYLGFCAGTKTTGAQGDPEASAHNVFIGTQAGFKSTIGSYNVNIGCYAGFENLDGWENVFMGGKAGYSGIHTSSATMVGNMAGAMYAAEGYVTFLGYFAGNSNQGQLNTFLGNWAGSNSVAGSDNVYIGNQAGQYAGGNKNVVIGNDAGRGFANSTNYQGSVLIGYKAGSDLDDNGDQNTMIGYLAGHGATGSGNVFIGANAGTGETLNQQLYIDNTDTYYPLIYGDFYSDWLAVYGDLSVYGTVYADAYDYNAKSGQEGLVNPLEKMLPLNGVTYSKTRKSEESKGGDPVTMKHIGLVAQEVEAVFPELVTERRDGDKVVNYSGMIPVLLEAIKEQQAQIEALEGRIAELEK